MKWFITWFLALVLAPATASAALPQGYQYLEKLVAPYVPTNQPTVEAMLRIAHVGPADFVIDLGSGDGRILITAAAKHGARGFGVDLDPQRIRESLENAESAGVPDRARFYQRDLFETKIAEASVITMYLLPETNLKLRPRFLRELRPGTRIVAHDFDMGDWKPDLRAHVRGTGSVVYFWVVPARVAGAWTLRVEGAGGPVEIELTQSFQEIEGTATRGGKPLYLREATLDGDRISFVLIEDQDFQMRQRFDGRVNAGVVEGTARGEGKAPRTRHKWRMVKEPS